MTAPLHNHGSGHHRRRSGPTTATATAAVAATHGSSSTRIPHVAGRTLYNIIRVIRTERLNSPRTHHAPMHPRMHHVPRVSPLRNTVYYSGARATRLSATGVRLRVRFYRRPARAFTSAVVATRIAPIEVLAAPASAPSTGRARVWAYF